MNYSIQGLNSGTCEWCGWYISLSKRSNARHCSEACHHQAKKAKRRLRRAAESKVGRICRKCTNPIPESRLVGSSFCSHSCVVSAQTSRRREECRKIANAAKAAGCSNCPEKRLKALDFHHTNPTNKVKEVAYLISKGSVHIVRDEIAKYIVLCANCHRCLPNSSGHNNLKYM